MMPRSTIRSAIRLRGRALRRVGSGAALAALLAVGGVSSAYAAEHITLSNGFEIDCIRRVPEGEKMRLYFAPSDDANDAENYLDVPAAAIIRIEKRPDAPVRPAGEIAALPHVAVPPPSAQDLRTLLSHAGSEHHIDAELLASVVHAESGGQIRAVSRTGARGLMQLMPGTAAAVGVKDSFASDQNIEGGSTYLDAMLTRYHDNIALALAAYNAGPAAVDRYRGVPPFRETRAYVSRVIREFNRRKAFLLAQNQLPQR